MWWWFDWHPSSTVKEANFASIYTFILLFLIYKYVCSLDWPLKWLWHLTSSLISNAFNKISNICSFYICVRAIILPFKKDYSLAHHFQCFMLLLRMLQPLLHIPLCVAVSLKTRKSSCSLTLQVKLTLRNGFNRFS